MEAKYKCQKCGYDFTSRPGPTKCKKCRHEYVEWANYEEMKKELGHK